MLSALRYSTLKEEWIEVMAQKHLPQFKGAHERES